MEGRGTRCLLNLRSCIPNHTDAMARRLMNECHDALPNQNSGTSSHLGHGCCGPWTINIRQICLPRYITKECGVADPNGWAATDEYGSHMGTWKQKVNTWTDTNIWHMNQWEAQLWKRKSHLWSTHGICLRRHLGLRLVLKHSSEANRTPRCVLQNQLWWHIHIMLNWC